MHLIERALERLQCPKCSEADLRLSGPGLSCGGCGAIHPVDDGIIDFFPEYKAATGRAQQAMENPDVVDVYEDQWRPWFTSQGSAITYDEEQAWLLERHRGRSPGCVLDLATGTGRYARILADATKARLVIAADVSMPMLRKARDVAVERGVEDVLFARCDAHALPLRDGVVGALNCFGALHLFEQPERAIGELARVGGPDAIFTCLTACRLGDPEQAQAQQDFSSLASFHFFDAEKLEAMLRSVGFEAFEHSTHGAVILFSARRDSAPPTSIDARRP